MNFQQLEQLWISNGGDPAVAPIMAAIAMAESTGNPSNTTGDNGTSWGLYQIHWTVHPQFNVPQLLDPNYNTNAAIQLSGNGQDLSPWTTWKDYIDGVQGTQGYNVISQYLGPPSQYVQQGFGTSGNYATPSSFWTNVQNTAKNFGTWIQNPFSVVSTDAQGNQQIQNPLQYALGGTNPVATSIFVGAAAIALVIIGGLWLALGNDTTRTMVVSQAKDALALT